MFVRGNVKHQFMTNITEETSKLFDAYIENEKVKLKIETLKNMDNIVNFRILFDSLNYISYKKPPPIITLFGSITNLGGSLGLFSFLK